MSETRTLADLTCARGLAGSPVWRSPASQVDPPNGSSGGDSGPLTRYDQLCRKHMNDVVFNGLSSTDAELHARVDEWEAKLEPILEEQHLRRPFDISEYGDKIQDSLRERQGVAGEHGVGAHCVPFKDVVAGAPQFEICRAFLAVLQLANSGKVEIVQERCALPSMHVPRGVGTCLLVWLPPFSIVAQGQTDLL